MTKKTIEIERDNKRLAKVEFSESEKGSSVYARIWFGKAINPTYNHSFSTKEKRFNFTKKTIENRIRHLEEKKQRKEKEKLLRNSLKTENTLKKGDIFYTSWGYDQTNYDYIVILEKSKTGKTVKCQRTSHLHDGTSAQSNVQEPIFQPFGDIFTLQVRIDSQGLYLVGSYPFCYDGTGSRRQGWFCQHTKGNQYHETMAEFGH